MKITVVESADTAWLKFSNEPITKNKEIPFFPDVIFGFNADNKLVGIKISNLANQNLSDIIELFTSPLITEQWAKTVDRYVRWFSFSKEELIREAKLSNWELSELQGLFNVDPRNPMFDCYEVTTTQQVEYLQLHIDSDIGLDIDGYWIMLECEVK